MANKSHDSNFQDRLKLLREYAQDANFEDVAIKLEYLQNAENYLRSYMYLVKNIQKDKDFPRWARLVPNKNVPAEFHINDDESKTFHPLVERLYERT